MSIIRMQSLYTISVGTDTSMDGVLIALYTSVEVNVAITCASLPANKALLQRIFPRLLSSKRGGGRSTNLYANMDGSTIAHGGSSAHRMRSLAASATGKSRSASASAMDDDAHPHHHYYKEDGVGVDVRTDIEISSSLDGSQTDLRPGAPVLTPATGGTFLADCWSHENVGKPAKGREAV
jgi:hypothetical protein